MKTKKTVTPFNMQEIARALREMISEDSPNASEALLSGTREAVFREIFIFHYPSFLENTYQDDTHILPHSNARMKDSIHFI